MPNMTGQELREMIRTLGMTQAEFAGLVEYHPAYVGNLCSTPGEIPAAAQKRIMRKAARAKYRAEKMAGQ